MKQDCPARTQGRDAAAQASVHAETDRLLRRASVVNQRR